MELSPEREVYGETSPSKGLFSEAHPPVKNRIKDIESNMRASRKGLSENRKESQVLKSELAQLENANKERTNEIVKELSEDIVHLEKDFRKLLEQDLNEVNFLKQQIANTNVEKATLQQNLVKLDMRISAVEHDVGFE